MYESSFGSGGRYSRAVHTGIAICMHACIHVCMKGSFGSGGRYSRAVHTGTAICMHACMYCTAHMFAADARLCTHLCMHTYIHTSIHTQVLPVCLPTAHPVISAGHALGTRSPRGINSRIAQTRLTTLSNAFDHV
jgi:hypothetical protein